MLTSLIRKAYSVVSGQLRTSCDGWYTMVWTLLILSRIILQPAISLKVQIIEGESSFGNLIIPSNSPSYKPRHLHWP